MRMAAGLDTGPVFARAVLKLNGTETGAELNQKLAELGGAQLPDILASIAAGELQPEPQDDAQASLCHKVKKEDGRIDWQQDSAEMIERKWRAYEPWPGIFTEFGGKRLKITELRIASVELSAGKFGEIFELDGRVFVQTIANAIELKKVQLEGKKELAIGEFVRGEADFVGSRI
jgi:methionyl-tRNA formyltransferase